MKQIYTIDIATTPDHVFKSSHLLLKHWYTAYKVAPLDCSSAHLPEFDRLILV